MAGDGPEVCKISEVEKAGACKVLYVFFKLHGLIKDDTQVPQVRAYVSLKGPQVGSNPVSD